MKAPRHFTAKPPRIEALRWDPDDPEAAGAAVGWLSSHGIMPMVGGSFLDDVKTLEFEGAGGLVGARPGDWIVRDRDGFWVWVPDALDDGYEPAPPGPAPEHLHQLFVRVFDNRTGEVIEVRLADEDGNGTALDVALALVPHFELWIDMARMKGQSLDVRLTACGEGPS